MKSSSATVWKYVLAWFGMMVLAILNGGVRELAYKPHVGDLAAHQISTVILLLLFAAYFRGLVKVWPIGSGAQAWVTGGMWALMTIGFELGLGLKAGMSWSRMLQAYNLLTGHLWLFIPLWGLIGPYVFYRFVQPRSHPPLQENPAAPSSDRSDTSGLPPQG